MVYAPFPLDEKVRVARAALALRAAALRAHRSPAGETLWRRMTNPEPGDCVIEDSTIHGLLHWHDHPDVEPRLTAEQTSVESLWDGQVTRYLRTSREWRPWYAEAFDPDYWPGPDDLDHVGGWYYTTPLDGYWETCLIVENPDGTEYRWTNASLMAVPLGGPRGATKVP